MGALPWSQLGPTGLLAIAVGLILFGWLVPVRVLRWVQQERNDWRENSRELNATVAELAANVAEGNELGKTTVALLRSIDGAARSRDKTDSGTS